MHQLFWNFGQKKGGGWTKSRNFWALFTLILVNYGQKSAAKVPKKKSAYEKVSQKFQKSMGGGVRPFWNESIIKLHFFYGKLP